MIATTAEFLKIVTATLELFGAFCACTTNPDCELWLQHAQARTTRPGYTPQKESVTQSTPPVIHGMRCAVWGASTDPHTKADDESPQHVNNESMLGTPIRLLPPCTNHGSKGHVFICNPQQASGGTTSKLCQVVVQPDI